MKIGINGRFLIKPYTGIGRYTRDLYSELARNKPRDSFIFAVTEKVEGELSKMKNVEIIILPEIKIGTPGMKKTYWEQAQVPRLLIEKGADILHFPYPSNPWRKINRPVVVTVHDTIPWTMEEYRNSLMTRLYQDRCKDALKYADHLFAVSEETKKEVSALCGPDKEKMTVIYNSPSDIFQVKVDENNKRKVLEKYGIDPERPFLLYVGGYDLRKNADLIVETFLSHIAPYHEIDLVMAGGKSHNSELDKGYDDLTKPKNGTSFELQKGKLIATGFIDETDLPALYQSCFAFLNLSRKEGFNLPLLEALTSEAATIVSDLPVHHEVAGDAATYCNPDDGECLASHLKRMIEDPAYYQKQKQKAGSFVHKFSRKKAALSAMEIFKSLICESSG